MTAGQFQAWPGCATGALMADVEPFDRALRRRRHAGALAGFGAADFLHGVMVDEIRERVATVARPFGAVLDLGGPAPAWPHGPGVVRMALATGGADVVGDEDRLPFADASFDLVVSAAGLASVSDLPGALVQARRVLRPDGLFVAAFVGGMTLAELRADLLAADIAMTGGAAARIAPMVEAQAAAGLLQRAGFAMPVADVERLTVRYGSIFGLLTDLAAMGARSPMASRSVLRRDVLADAAARFAGRADADGKSAVTVEILHLAGWAPAPGQPVPLQPGSATTSLADALKHRV
jgi:NADH dehydrogenase [ubiquinone] 1 alpha subcomplex assembly factor 5